MVSKRAKTKMALQSIRCEIRTLGEILIEDGGGMPGNLLMPAQILILEEVEICDGIPTVRSFLVLYM